MKVQREREKKSKKKRIGKYKGNNLPYYVDIINIDSNITQAINYLHRVVFTCAVFRLPKFTSGVETHFEGGSFKMS